MFINSTENIHKLRAAKCFVFDMDGTICLGDTPFPCARDFINAQMTEKDKSIAFFTNNTSKNIVYYYNKLVRMGFEVTPSQVISSAEVTAAYLLKHRRGKSVYLVGTSYLREALEGFGIPLTEDEPDIVLSSFDTSLTYHKLERACTYLRGGAEWLSTHPDINCPTEDGFIPDSGAINAAIAASTGLCAPRYFGKPYSETADMLCEILGVAKSEMVIFGDRLYTDIALGKRNGILSVLVLSGETTAQMLAEAEAADLPDLVFADLGEVAGAV